MKYVKGDEIKSIQYECVHFIAAQTEAHPYPRPGDVRYLSPMECYDESMGGFVCGDILAEFEVDDDQPKPRYGVYYKNLIIEYTMESYSKKNAKLIKFMRPDPDYYWFSGRILRLIAIPLINYRCTHPYFDQKYYDSGMLKYLQRHNIGHKWYMSKDEYMRLKTKEGRK